MYITPRTAQVRNLAVSAINGIVTLVILLIAPLGLAAVIINTVLVTLATYATATASDRILLRYLQRESTRAELLGTPGDGSLQRRSNASDLDR
ncbi:hypothetical protein DO97_03490 [Neosynechococcus sphagnicola sy1]|uniref:Uncharacterized protein n=1 Tax=Neosynechococcus sphagnicola sy1 TaxID=1497020 RepID=A0A098TKF1_9CYAN|nr:CRISPR-associated protein Csx18 [Neosynechococcus sphagnicola]KGF72815.1 hypothetical protein DO97_03490 [Neosynechococcus sphagnicola sy1]